MLFRSEKASEELRENHSGMETPDKNWLLLCFGCVRTIVVWKHSVQHCLKVRHKGCVRTIVVWKQKPNYQRAHNTRKLRENHSGMETDFAGPGESDANSCVRTIVVWKPTSTRSTANSFN